MHDLSSFQRFYLTYLGRMYAFTFRTKVRRILGISVGSWLQFIVLVLLFVAWVSGMVELVLVLLAVVFLWLRFSYWRAARSGYNKFMVDKTAVSPTADFEPLKPDERVKLRASGLFALSSRETAVLLRPAEYWKAPLGDHTIMVEQGNDKFLYQFFNRATLEKVEAGWLIFGREPMRALSVTFCTKWGPTFTDFAQMYYVRGDNDEPPCQRRNITFTFASDREHAAVWHNILQDLIEA